MPVIAGFQPTHQYTGIGTLEGPLYPGAKVELVQVTPDRGAAQVRASDGSCWSVSTEYLRELS